MFKCSSPIRRTFLFYLTLFINFIKKAVLVLFIILLDTLYDLEFVNPRIPIFPIFL